MVVPKQANQPVESIAEGQASLPNRQERPYPLPFVARSPRNDLFEFVKCNRYFEGHLGKPEEAEDWIARVELSFRAFQVAEDLKVSYATYLLRLRARLWWDFKEKSLPQPVSWDSFKRKFLK